MTCTRDPETGVCYESTYSDKTDVRTYVLKDTSFDVSLKQDKQKVEQGSFILYDYSTHLTSALVLKGELKYRMSEYDMKTDLGTMVVSTDIGIHEVVKVNITQITPKGEVFTDVTDGPETKDNYLGDIQFDSFVGSLEDWGYEITYGDKHTDTIDTLYGKRHVTIQTLNAYDADDEIMYVYTLTYGDKGMIYSHTLSSDSGSDTRNVIEGKWVIEGTSLKL